MKEVRLDSCNGLYGCMLKFVNAYNSIYRVFNLNRFYVAGYFNLNLFSFIYLFSKPSLGSNINECVYLFILYTDDPHMLKEH